LGRGGSGYRGFDECALVVNGWESQRRPLGYFAWVVYLTGRLRISNTYSKHASKSS
jgi:hypothetical protein